MDEQQQRILDDLKSEFSGELRFDAAAREIYSCDASIYQILPLGVALPHSTEDVVLLCQYASENDVPLIPRGAGSGLAGGCLGRGLIVDFSRHMNRILAVDDSTVRVQAGVVRDQLNEALRDRGMYFPPDPSNTAVTTIGGMLAVDAAGSHAVRVGSMRDHVQRIQTVLANGTVFEARRYENVLAIPEPGVEEELVHQLALLLQTHEGLIRERQPPLIRNCSGFQLRGVLEENELDLPRLLVGSEGALGLFTEATLHISPRPEQRGVALLLFEDIESSVRAIQKIIPLQPSACDLMDRRLLSLAREFDEDLSKLIPEQAEAAVLVEQTGYSERQVRDRLRDVMSAARSIDSQVYVAKECYDDREVDSLWSLPYRVVPLLTRLRGLTRPLPLIEDIAVPPECLHEFLTKAQRIFQKYWVTASLYAHAASGQIHFRPFLPIPNNENSPVLESLSRDLYETVFQFGGTVSGEHGNGLARTAFVRSQYGPLYRVFQEVKDLFDPHNLMNPGKILNDDPHLTIRDLRINPDPKPQPSSLVNLQLNWRNEEIVDELLRCNGCGSCKVVNDSTRMCPFFAVDPLEANSPRAKANLVRSLVTNSLDPKAFSTDEAKELADSCFNCKQCHLECPSNVNIPALAIEAKAQCVNANGLSRADWYLSRAHSFGRLGVAISPLANWSLGNSMMRWLIEKLLGISQSRRLPKFARRQFLKSSSSSKRQSQDQLTEKANVVYFVDYFANFHDTELAEAFVRILDHNCIPVLVPKEQVASGMAMICAGDLDAARELAEINLSVLGEAAREGKQIVCTEPTAAVCLKEEYPRLLDHPDALVVAEQTIDAGTFLQQLHHRGELKKDFSPFPHRVVHHTPCHQRYLNPSNPLVELLRLIPELTIEEIEKGCSGMAGTFGMTATNFERSLEFGSELILEMQRDDLEFGATECSSCQFQMLQESSVPTLHPLKLMALAYGLMPSLKNKLTPSRNKRLLTT
ncbi:FAD-linked oxidase C-terminal domain-containing protein [Thalassoglobus sp. JC818]|uniref:FAD-binding and (Fe-S)-binding domain-containing protein n=1 Tax=Thalassoglobus sp. JC818 TaxID=3232136 RepID=UPI003459C235